MVELQRSLLDESVAYHNNRMHQRSLLDPKRIIGGHVSCSSLLDDD